MGIIVKKFHKHINNIYYKIFTFYSSLFSIHSSRCNRLHN